MAKVTIDMIIGVLKYMDIEYMSDDECDSIYDLDINDEKNQKDIIMRLIGPGVKLWNDQDFNMTKEALKMGIEDVKAATKVFNRMSFPFEDEIVDKKGFLKLIYQELFESKE